jgi:colanic acid/amylovoran biosynthesis protein
MIVEIRKAGFVNKGAELMLYAIIDKMKELCPDIQYAMTPHLKFAPYIKRAELGFLQTAWLLRYGFQWGNLATLAPKKIRKMYGVVLDKEVDVVLDAAGFSYSDQWGIGNSIELATSCKRWKKVGTKVILLPQAFGPFTSSKIKDAIRSVADNADLIFARERISYDHLVSVVGERENVKLAPDFTNLTKGIVPKNFDSLGNRFCIIPNYRMVDKTSKEQSETYLPFMIRCVRYLLEKNEKPFVLIHEGADDLMLSEQIRDAVGGNLPIVKESHPLMIKGILGACEGTLGSRFHGLVSALSQGVPALATGWSHKYQMLFEDYGFNEGLIDVTMSEEEIRQKIDLIIDPQSKGRIKSTIATSSKGLKINSLNMWDEVFKVFRL